MEFGVQFVTTGGTILMLELLVQNLVILETVSGFMLLFLFLYVNCFVASPSNPLCQGRKGSGRGTAKGDGKGKGI